MKELASLLLLMTLWCAPVFAQDKNKVSNFIRNVLATRSKEIIDATVEMPADKFGARPSPEQMTFAQLTIHVASVNYLYCSTIAGIPEPELQKLGDADPKDKLLARLKASFEFCAAALAKLDDSNKSEMLSVGETKTTRAMAILTLSGTWNDHFAQQADCFQAIGRVLPTAQK